MSEPVLRLQNIHKSFGPRAVLRGIDLAVDAHEVVALIGASGSGKSTLLRTINLLERVDDGQVWLRGVDISDPRTDVDSVRARIGVVFQHFNLFPHLSVLDNVTLASRRVLRQRRDAGEARCHGDCQRERAVTCNSGARGGEGAAGNAHGIIPARNNCQGFSPGFTCEYLRAKRQADRDLHGFQLGAQKPSNTHRIHALTVHP